MKDQGLLPSKDISLLTTGDANNTGHYADYIIYHEDGDLSSENARTVNIKVQDFAASSNLNLRIISNGLSSSTELYNLNLTTDSNGDANYEWFINNLAHTGEIIVEVTVGTQQIVKKFFVYCISNGDFESTTYSPKVFTGASFFKNGDLTLMNNYSTYTIENIQKIYDLFINTFKFPDPHDEDSNNKYEVYFSNVFNAYSSWSIFQYTNHAWIESKLSSIGKTGVEYTKLVLAQTLTHEFYHSIEFVNGDNLNNWSEYKFILEGQARMFETIAVDSLRGGLENITYLNGSFFYNNFSNGIKNISGTELYKNSYDYCFFWRFLIENQLGVDDSDFDKVNLIHDIYKSCNVARTANSIESDFENIINNNLSSHLGNFSNLDEVYEGIVKNIYYNEPDHDLWNPELNNLNASIRWIDYWSVLDSKKTLNNTINNPFNIHYYKYDISDIDMLNIKFDGNPNSVATPADFSVQYFIESTDGSFTAHELAINNSAGEENYTITTENVSDIVIGILRKDVETTVSGNYGLELTPTIESNIQTLVGANLPSMGTTSDNFYFSTIYTDDSGSNPQSVNLKINGGTVEMGLESGSVSTGATYSTSYSNNVANTYSYYFEAISSDGTVLRYPEISNLSLKINESAEGWDIAIDELNHRISPSSPNAGSTFDIDVTVKNLGEYTYSSVVLKTKLVDKNGDVLDTDQKTLTNLVSKMGYAESLSMQVPSNAEDGSYQVITSVETDKDADYSNNSSTRSFFIGTSLPNDQFICDGQKTVEWRGAPGTEKLNINGTIFTLIGTNSFNYADLSDPNGDLETINQGNIEIYGSLDRCIAVEAVYDISGVGYAAVYGGYAVTSGAASYNTLSVSGVPGSKVYFYATVPSGLQFENTDGNHEVWPTSSSKDYLKDWYRGIDSDDGYKNIEIEFLIPTDASLGKHSFIFKMIMNILIQGLILPDCKLKLLPHLPVFLP